MDDVKMLENWLLEIGAEGGDLVKRLDVNQKRLAIDVLTDIANLRIKEMSGGDMSRDHAIAASSLKDLKAATSIEFATTVNNVLQRSASMAGSVIKGLLGSIFG